MALNPCCSSTDIVTTLTDNGDGSFTYVSEDNTVVTIDACQLIVDGGCSDSLVDNLDGSFTHTAVDGTVVTIPTPPALVDSTLVDNLDGTFTYTDESSTVTVIDVTQSRVVDNGDGTFTHQPGDGADTTLDVCALIADGGCTDSVVVEIDGSVTHTALDGTVVVIPAGSGETVTTLVDNGDGSFTYTSEDSTVTVWDETTTTLVDNANGSFTYTNENGSVVVWNETTSTLVDNGNGSFTYTNENGGVTNWAQTVTTLGKSGDLELTYVDENNATHVIDLCSDVAACETTSTLVDNLDGSFTYTDEDGTVTTWTESTTSLARTGNLQLTYTDEVGAATVLNLCADVAACETTTSLAYNSMSGDLTYVDEDGASTVLSIPVENFLANATYDEPTNILTLTLINGTVFNVDLSDLAGTGGALTTITDNDNGTFTYVDEELESTVIDVCKLVDDGKCRRVRDYISESTQISGASGTSIGAHPSSILDVVPGNVVTMMVTAEEVVALNGTVDIELVINGVATGQVVTINNGATIASATFTESFLANQLWTFRAVSGTATSGTLENLAVTIEIEK